MIWWSARLQKVLLTHRDGDDFLLFSDGSQAVLQMMRDGAPISSGVTCLTIQPLKLSSLDGNAFGFFLSGDQSGCHLGIITSNVQRVSMIAGFSPDELGETGCGTVSGRSFQVTTPQGSNAYRMRFDLPSGSLVTQAFRSGSWVDLSYQGPNRFATAGSNYLGGDTIVAGNLSVPSGSVSFPSASIDAHSLNGILALSNLPIIPTTQISGLLLSASPSGASATSLSVSGPTTLGVLTATATSLGVLSAGATTVAALTADLQGREVHRGRGQGGHGRRSRREDPQGAHARRERCCG
jgi:hypothetical protein